MGFQENQKKSNIGFTIFKNCSKEPLDATFVQNAFNVAGKSDAFINSREVSATFLLPAGNYCLIPSTFDRAESGSFLLRLFVDSRWKCEARDASFDGEGLHGIREGEPALSELPLHDLLLPVLLLLLLSLCSWAGGG